MQPNNHQAVRDNILPGDILLSRQTDDPISKIIQGITRSNWSHSFLSIGDNKILESNWDGVVVRPLDDYLSDQYSIGLFRHKVEITEEQSKVLIKRARKLLGVHYGFLQLFWHLVLRLVGKSEDPDFSLDVDTGMICTEVIATAYQKIGINFKDLAPSQMEPVDFDDSPITVRIA